MTRVAAIDCGTNSIRLLVADATVGEDGRPCLADLPRQMRIVRRGQGVDARGYLDPAAIERTVEATVEYQRMIEKLGATRTRFVATSATRDASNSAEFVRQIKAVIGVEPEVVVGTQEASLSVSGAVGGLGEGVSAPMLVVDIGGGTTDCSLLLMGPQWRERADRQQSLLGHSGCRIGGNDLDIALAFKCLMPLLGMGGETEKGTALPILPWWNAVAINDVPAQSDFYSTANGRLLNDLLRSARDADKVALLLKVWRQRLSYRLVRSAEESKIALSSAASVETALPFIQDDLATAIAQQGLEAALDQPLTRIMEQVRLALDSSQTTPDVIYLTGGSARSPLIKKALAAQLPGIPLAGGDDFGSVTAGLARWAQVVFS